MHLHRDIRETNRSLSPLCVTPWGLPLNVLPTVSPMAASDTFIPPDADARLQRHPVGAAWLAEMETRTPFANERVGYSTWRNIPSRILEQVFTTEEVRRLWWGGSVVVSCLSDRFDHDPLLAPQWQIRNSMWQYGWSFKDEYEYGADGKFKERSAIAQHAFDMRRYNLFGQFCAGIRRFTFGEGFTTYLNHVRSANEYGLGQWGRGKPVYLDGKLAFIVCKDGRHVLTVGFNPSARGLLVSQVQLREKRGNRWLYKLPAPLLEYVLKRLRMTFELPVWIVTGQSAAKAIRSAYGLGACPPDEELARIEHFYGPARSAVRERRCGREFALAVG